MSSKTDVPPPIGDVVYVVVLKFPNNFVVSIAVDALLIVVPVNIP